MIATTKCPICGQPGRKWFSRQGRSMLKCKDCRFAWVPEGVAFSGSGCSIYEDQNPVFFEDGNQSYYLSPASMANARAKLDVVMQAAPGTRTLLDIGAGFGHFVKAAAERGVSASGIEISPVAVAWAQENFGIRLTCGSVDNLPALTQGVFDVVTMWDVVEHLSDPGGAISEAAKLLAPGGVLIMSTPDFGSFASRLMGRHWHYLDIVQHIALFGRKAMTALLGRQGLKPVHWRTMGHRYELGYVGSRLDYLYGGFLGKTAEWLGLEVPDRIRKIQVGINLFDVMVVVCRKASPDIPAGLPE